MAIRSQKSEKRNNYNYLIDADYLCDKKADLQAFTETPKMGTTVFVIEDSAYYMADSSGKFVEISVGSSGGGGGGGGGGASSADEVSYDNTDSGLEADNVQDAIDEVANAGGSGGVFLVTITYDEQTYSADKTFAEIQNALSAGQFVVGRKKNGNSTDYIYCRVTSSDSEFIMFVGPLYIMTTSDADVLQIVTFYITSNNEVGSDFWAFSHPKN